MEIEYLRDILDKALKQDGESIWFLICRHIKGDFGLPPQPFILTKYLASNFDVGEKSPNDCKWIRVESSPNIVELLKQGKEPDLHNILTQTIKYRTLEYNKNPLSVVPYYRLKETIDEDWKIAQENQEREAKEEAERIAKEEAERKAREEAERIAKEEAERKAKEMAKRIAQSVAEQKAKEKAERKAKEEKLVEQTSLIAADDIQKLKASFALVKGGTFLSRFSEEGQHIEEIGDFYISELKVSKLLGDSLLSDGTDRTTADGQQTLTRRLSMLLGFEVSVTSISQLEYVLRGGDQLNQSQIERSMRYLASSNLRINNCGIYIDMIPLIRTVNGLFKDCCIHLVCTPETFAVEIERKAKEEAERKAKEEAERKAKEEAERKAKEEAEHRAKEEAERKAKEEAERNAKEEAECKAKEEAERKAKEEAERKAKEEAERRAKEEAERKAKEEAERNAKEEAERSSYKSLIEEFVSDTKECEYKDGIIFGKKKTIRYVAAPITKPIWNAVVNKTAESDFDDYEYVPQKELGDFIKELNAHFEGRVVFEYLHKNIHANVHLQVYEKLDKNACFVFIKEDNR